MNHGLTTVGTIIFVQDGLEEEEGREGWGRASILDHSFLA